MPVGGLVYPYLNHIECGNCGRRIELLQYRIGDVIICKCEFVIGKSTGDGIEPW